MLKNAPLKRNCIYLSCDDYCDIFIVLGISTTMCVLKCDVNSRCRCHNIDYNATENKNQTVFQLVSVTFIFYIHSYILEENT